MDELLVECSIHLDGVPLKDVRIFKCGHGFCTTCIEALFARSAPFRCPTCRKRIVCKDGLQIFLNPHRIPTQPGTQFARRASPSNTDLVVPDGVDATAQRVYEGSHEYMPLLQRVEQLQQQFSDVDKARGTLKDENRVLQREIDALGAQNDALKSRYTDLENEHNVVLRRNNYLQKEYETVSSDARQWRRDCKKAQADALALRKEKDIQDEAMTELVERERAFRHRAHANKVAHDKYKRKCDALQQELEDLRRNRKMTEDPEDESLLVVNRDAPDKLEHAVDEDWLDEVCEVRGDRLDLSDDTDDSGKENTQEVQQWSTSQATGSEADRERPLPADRPRPTKLFTSEWNLERDSTKHNKIHEKKKRKNQEEAVIGAPPGKIVKVTPTRGKARTNEERDDARLPYPPLVGSVYIPAPKFQLPLKLDSRGHLMGAAALGTRRKFDKTS